MWRELFTRALSPAPRARVNNSRHTSLLAPRRIRSLKNTCDQNIGAGKTRPYIELLDCIIFQRPQAPGGTRKGKTSCKKFQARGEPRGRAGGGLRIRRTPE